MLPGLLPAATDDPEEELRRQQEASAAPLNYSADGTGGGGAPTAPVEAAPAAPAMSQFPAHTESTHVEGAQDSTTRTTLDPRQVKAIEAGRAASEESIKAEQAKGAAAVGTKQNEGKEAAAQAAEQERFAKAAVAARVEADKEIARTMAAGQQRRTDMEKAAANRHTTFWADKGAPAELLSIFLVGLSDRSHRLSGGEGASPVQKMLDAKLAEDTRIKLAKFEDSKEFVALAKEDESAARAAKTAKLAEIRDEHMVIVDGIGKQFKAIGSKYGTDEARAKADAEVAKVKETREKLLADQYSAAATKATHTSGKTSTTTTDNVTTKADPNAAKTPTIPDVEKRQALIESEKSTRELQRLALNNPGAIEQMQSAIRKFGLPKLEGQAGVVDSVARHLGALVGRPTTADEALKDADPDARQAFSLLQNLISAKAKARGGAITEGDQQSVITELAVLGRSPKELAHAAEAEADKAARTREGFEGVRSFPNAAPDTRGGTPEELQRTLHNRELRGMNAEIAKIDSSAIRARDGKYDDLSTKAREAVLELHKAVKAGSDATAEAKAAREAGAPSWMVDGLLAGKKRGR